MYNFAKLENGHLAYAPNNLYVDGVLHNTPPDELYLAAGWRRVLDCPPTEDPGEGYEWRAAGWEEEGSDEITRVYERAALPPPPPKTYSKYRLGVAIQRAGLLGELLEWFAADPAAKFHWDNALDFVADDPNFIALKTRLEAQFGAADVAAILAQAETTGEGQGA